MNETIRALVTKMLSSENIGAKAFWHACQWDSYDGTEQELKQFIEWHGEPGEIQIYEK
jgi:hypothetical protein